MRRFLSLTTCGLSALIFAACERETLERQELSSIAEGDPDASVEPATMMTSDTPAAVESPNTPCSDRDHDGVCDGKDMCPDDPSATCSAQPATSTCAGLTAPVPPITTLPTVLLTKLSVGGKPVNGALTVRKNELLDITFSVSCRFSPGIPPLTMSAGFEGKGKCEVVAGCPTEDATVSIALTAPSTTGPHYVKVAVHQEIPIPIPSVSTACQTALDNEVKDVIALCVTD